MPYTLAIAASAMLVVRLFGRLSPRIIGIVAFAIVASGLTILALTIRSSWGTPIVILCLIFTGLGEGALLTLLFNVMVSASPKELAGDVGALRGVANNLSTALGTAFAGLMAVGLLTLFVTNSLLVSDISAALRRQLDLNNVDFITNTQLESILSETMATDNEVAKAVRINEEARLRTLKASFLILAAISLLGLVPAWGLPKYVPGEVPDLVDEAPVI